MDEAHLDQKLHGVAQETSSNVVQSAHLADLPDPTCRTGIVSLPLLPGKKQVCCPNYCGECSDYPTCGNVRGQSSAKACCASQVLEMQCGRGAPANVCLRKCTESLPPCIMDGGIVLKAPDKSAASDCNSAVKDWRLKAEAAISAGSGTSKTTTQGATTSTTQTTTSTTQTTTTTTTTTTKGGALPGDFNKTCAAKKLASDERVIFFLHDDPNKDDIPDTAAGIAEGFQTSNAAYDGNKKLAQMKLTGLKICLEEPTMDTTCTDVCYDVKADDFTYKGPGIPAEIKDNFQKVVIALSGQIDDGNTENGGNGEFIKTKLTGKEYCPGMEASSSPMKCWSCLSWGTGGAGGKIRQWSGDSANWHVWGFGVSMFRTGGAGKPFEELKWGRPDTDFKCNGARGPWDTFYIVAKGEFPEGM